MTVERSDIGQGRRSTDNVESDRFWVWNDQVLKGPAGPTSDKWFLAVSILLVKVLACGEGLSFERPEAGQSQARTYSEKDAPAEQVVSWTSCVLHLSV